MAFFWFVIVVVLSVILISRPKVRPDAGYQQGYWDGYRALGSKVQQQLNRPHEELDRNALQAAVGVGITGVETSPELAPAAIAVEPSGASNAALVSDVQLVDSTLPVQATAPSPEMQSVRNLNVILYVASFLLVAAGALFVGGTMPDSVKLIGMWFIIGAFYMGGYLLYQQSVRLRPAAMAFLGTGMALIPFVGIALHQYGSMPAEAAWLLTSIVGVAVYLFTAIRLQSQLVSYLTIAFVLSLVMAGPASASLGVVWQFTTLMAVALCASSLALIKPNWVPAVFSRPLEDMGQIVTPLVLIASLFVGDNLKITGYEIVFSVATAYYVVALLQSRTVLHETALRVVASVTALLFTYDAANDNGTVIGVALLAIATIQAAYSIARFKVTGRQRLETSWLISMFAIQAISFAWWQSDPSVDVLNLIGWLIMGLTSAVALLLLRQVWFGLPGVLASFAIPFVVARTLIEPALPFSTLSMWFALATGLLLVVAYHLRGRSVAVRLLLTVAYVGYSVLGLATAIAHESLGFTATIFGIFTVMLAVASYALRQTHVLVFSALLLFAAIGCSWSYFEFDSDWSLFGPAWIGAAILYGGSWVSNTLRVQLVLHRQILVAFAAVALAIAGVVQIGSSDKSMAAFAALSLLASAAIVGVEGYRAKRTAIIELSIYIATISLQRYVGLLQPDLNVMFYGHWWAITIAAASGLYPHLQRTMSRLIIGLAIMSAVSASYALGEGGWYQWLFLLEHLALLMFGALRAKSWALWWGLAGSVLAVMYFMGGLNFLSLAFLGLLLIGIVVWRLLRGSKTPTS